MVLRFYKSNKTDLKEHFIRKKEGIKVKKFFLIFLVMIIVGMAALVGCSSEIPENYAKDEIPEENPFAADRGDSESRIELGAFTFGPAEALSNEGPVSFDYNGGELVIDYFIENDSADSSLEYGLFLFLEGVPQYFKIDDSNAENSFFHAFKLDANERKEFQIIFTPTQGKAGETLEISFAGIFNPGFVPDSEKMSYGVNHNMSSNNPFKLTFHENTGYTGQNKQLKEEVLKNISYSEEEISTDMRKEYKHGDVNELDQSIYVELYEEGNYVRYNNKKIVSDGKEAVKLIFRGFGQEGVTYKTTFYLNHQPIGIQGHDYLEWHTIKGSIAEFKMNLDVSQLEGNNTLYSISVPIEGGDDDFILKTDSMLLMTSNQ